MNILVTGANGQLGNEMRVLSAENQQHTYFFTDVQELDICDEQAIRAFVTGCYCELCRLYGSGQGRRQSRTLR